MADYRKTLVLDFDGVLHSYAGGWQGAAVIADPPVPGALEALVGYLDRFNVAIVSARSHQWGGRRAMKRWLRKWFSVWDHDTLFLSKPEWVQEFCAESVWAANDASHEAACDYVAERIVKRIRFPRHKPPAHLTIDDRAVTFQGPSKWPTVEEIEQFNPWNRA